VYLDAKSRELEKLLKNEKLMIIRGATGRKIPYRKVAKNDLLYFINNNAEGEIKAIAEVIDVINSEKMDKEISSDFIKNYQDKLQLTDRQFRRWAGKRYIVLVEVKNVKEITPFKFNRDIFKNNMDDWLIFEDINEIKK
jgi:hypothetical protein